MKVEAMVTLSEDEVLTAIGQYVRAGFPDSTKGRCLTIEVGSKRGKYFATIEVTEAK